MPKLVALLAVVAVLVYLIISLIQRRSGGGTGGVRRRPPAVPPRAPDDDPGFLRELDDQLWRERQQPDSDAAEETDGAHDDDRQTPP